MWDMEGFGFFAATLKADGGFVGWLGLNRVLDDPDLGGSTEIGWFIDRRHWEQGLATEGARVAVTCGFDALDLDRIIARCRTDNVVSGRVREKIGMGRWQVVADGEIPNATITMYEISAKDRMGSEREARASLMINPNRWAIGPAGHGGSDRVPTIYQSTSSRSHCMRTRSSLRPHFSPIPGIRATS